MANPMSSVKRIRTGEYVSNVVNYNGTFPIVVMPRPIRRWIVYLTTIHYCDWAVEITEFRNIGRSIGAQAIVTATYVVSKVSSLIVWIEIHIHPSRQTTQWPQLIVARQCVTVIVGSGKHHGIEQSHIPRTDLRK